MSTEFPCNIEIRETLDGRCHLFRIATVIEEYPRSVIGEVTRQRQPLAGCTENDHAFTLPILLHKILFSGRQVDCFASNSFIPLSGQYLSWPPITRSTKNVVRPVSR